MERLEEYVDQYQIEDPIRIDEMARIGFLEKTTPCKYEIYVMTDDPGKIPHFHIRDYKKGGRSGKEFHTCIDLTQPKYFHHPGKQDELNRKQLRELVDFLTSKYKGREETNWQHVIDAWNDNNSDVELDIHSKIPNYVDIEDNK